MAKIWIQTKEPADVVLKYRLSGKVDESYFESETYKTESIDANTATVMLDKGLSAGNTYEYQVYINGKLETPIFPEDFEEEGEAIPLTFQTKPRWRFVPDGDVRHSVFDFRIGAASCNYVNEEGHDREGGSPYGGEHEIYKAVYEKNPDLMLWLGDNVYYRENDFEDRSGMMHRWTHDRNHPWFLPLMTRSQHYATWDDHDYGPNDIGSSYWLKDTALEVFTKFWANPSAGLPELPGLFTFFNWGDVNFYLMDNRTYLSIPSSDPEAFGNEKSMLGKEQVDWLIDHLAWAQSQMSHDGKSYPARFNVICVGNQVLSDSDSDFGYRSFTKEWQYLIDRIVHEGIDGVIFLSGDVHFGEVSKLTYLGKGKPGEPGKAGIKGEEYVMYDITTSSLTAGSWAGSDVNHARYDIFDEEDIDRVGHRNFATLDFKGPLDDRRMEIRYWNSKGELVNQKKDAPEGTVTDASILYAKDLVSPKNK
ncbi:alkaline phosphatase family protein [Puniceicoccaceae bacterium K14]|nr:alkaline phosphatase family protein [Puniceicoccaceae bacterium K14]